MTTSTHPPTAADPLAGASPYPPRRRTRNVNRLGQWLGRHAERLFLLYLLLQVSGAYYSPPVVGVRGAPVGQSSLLDSLFVVFYLILGVLLLWQAKNVVRVAFAHWWTLVVICFVGVSWIWSYAPDVTLNRTVAVLVTCSFGWYLVVRYPPREIVRLYVIVLTFAALLSLGYGVVNPGLTSGLEWRGVFEHKNVFARAMVLNATMCLLLLMEPIRFRWLIWASFGLSCAMVGLSLSATGAILLMTLAFLIRFHRVFRLRATILIPFLIGGGILVVAGLAWLQLNAAEAAGQVGKDATLTGRTDLWAVALRMIQRHPWFGYGFGGFWRGPLGDSGEFWRAVKWRAPHAHNGFVDLTLDLGVVGLALFLVGLIGALIAALNRARSAQTISAVAPFVMLMFLTLYNLTESSLLRHNTMYLVMYAVGTSLALGGGDRRQVPGG